MKSSAHFSLAILLTLGLCFSASAKEEADKTPGVKIGEKAPDFELLNHLGKKTKLAEIVKQGPVAIVFHRSADW